MEALLWFSLTLNVVLIVFIAAVVRYKDGSITTLNLPIREKKQKPWDARAWGSLLPKPGQHKV